MYSVTQRIKMVNQPRGGYINRKQFTVTSLEDEKILSEEENIPSSLIGIVVDYMTRFMMGVDKKEAFKISLLGADYAQDLFHAKRYLSKIKALDVESVKNACKLAGYDVCFRAGMMYYKPVEEINPDLPTVQNIIIMVKRCIRFLEKNGPIVKEGFTFEGGYTDVISSGDGDYLTKDTLWDFKVSNGIEIVINKRNK